MVKSSPSLIRQIVGDGVCPFTSITVRVTIHVDYLLPPSEYTIFVGVIEASVSFLPHLGFTVQYERLSMVTFGVYCTISTVVDGNIWGLLYNMNGCRW